MVLSARSGHSASMKDYLQLIGHALQNICPVEARKLLLYAEVEDGVTQLSVFFDDEQGRVNFRFASDELETLTYEFWETGADKVLARSWCGLEYGLLGSQLTVNFLYSEEFDPDEGQSDRRPRVVARHFPGCTVDYSRPSG
ncbi:hypothetical protein ACWKW4_20910 [Hydrogenophaga borbori]